MTDRSETVPCRPSEASDRRSFRVADVLATASVALAVASAAMAQQINQGPITNGPIKPIVVGGSRSPGFGIQAGRGQALGDGNLLGGQTFSWSLGGGRGEALGGGNALDANSQVGSGGLNSPGVAPDFRSRNLIVTGNVPGGRGFRGSVGYTAESDFRGSLGSDDNFAWRADSALSNPVFTNSSLARDRFMLAQGLGDFQYRRDTTPIEATPMSIGSAARDARLRLDRASSEMALSRAGYDMGEDRLIAKTLSPDNEPIRFVASPLRGLQAQSLNDPLFRSGLGLYEIARARQDMAAGISEPSDYANVRSATRLTLSDADRMSLKLDQRPASEAPLDFRINPNATPRPVEDRAKSPYQSILDSVGKKEGADAAAAAGIGELDRIRAELDALRGVGSKKEGEEDGTPAKPTEAEGQKPTVEGEAPAAEPRPFENPTLPGGAPFPEGSDSAREKELEERLGKRRSVAELAEILRHRKTINELAGDDRRRVNELIRQGEEALRRGDYFQAERRFDQAEGMASDNPLVEIGRAHAQLGAGLHLSAALTLRSLFAAHPELVDTRYDRALFPPKDRIDRAVALLRDRIGRGEDVPSYGLVLAYIGHQLGDAALVEEGLGVIGGNRVLDTNRELLRGIWLGGK